MKRVLPACLFSGARSSEQGKRCSNLRSGNGSSRLVASSVGKREEWTARHGSRGKDNEVGIVSRCTLLVFGRSQRRCWCDEVPSSPLTT